MKYITKQLGSQIERMEENSVVLLQAPPGMGKTTYILKNLFTYCRTEHKEMLLIVNRNALKGQVKQTLLKHYGIKTFPYVTEDTGPMSFDSVVVCSYQYIQKIIAYNHNEIAGIPFAQFDFVVADEIHYLLKDSLFSGETHYLKSLPRLCWRAVRIYISATLEPVKEVIMEIEQVQDIAPDYDDNILTRLVVPSRYISSNRVMTAFLGYPIGRNVLDINNFRADYSYLKPHFFNEDEDIADIISISISKNDHGKWLVFVDSKAEGERIKEKLNGLNIRTAFICAGVKDADGQAEYQSLVQKRRFESQVLCCTNVIDNGVSIEDKGVNHVVLSAYDSVQAIQQLGRIRRVPGLIIVDVFLCRYSASYFNRKRFSLLQKLKIYNLYKNGDKGAIIKFLEQNGPISLDGIGHQDERTGRWESNTFCEGSLRYHISELDDNIDHIKADQNGFLIKELSWFGVTYSEEDDVAVQQKKVLEQQLQKLLNENIEIKLTAETWNVVRVKIRLLYEAITGEKLCSGRQDRMPGIGKIREIAIKYGYMISSDSGDYFIRRVKE